MRRAWIVGVAGVCLLVFAGGSVASSLSVQWGSGVEATLPANAATGVKQSVVINSVSCPSAGNCAAVGSYIDNAGATEGLLLTEAAGTWATGVELALPSDAAAKPYVSLDQVSCGSAGNCTAVGAYSTASSGAGVMVTETAGVWGTGVNPVPPANAAADSEAGLGSVSCTAAGSCTATGGYIDSLGAEQGLMLTETNGSWGTGVEAQLPAKAATGKTQQVALTSLSCASPGNCAAVGVYENNSGGSEGLLLSEKAGSWATGVKAHLPANAATASKYAGDVVIPLAVSCGSAGNCSAVGNYCAVGSCNNFDNSGPGGTGEQGLLISEKGGSWKTGVEAQLPADAAKTGPMQYINSISCSLAGNCTAAGSYWDGSIKNQLVLLTETGGTWARGVEPALPANAAAKQEELGTNAVSCSSPGDCTVSGGYSRGMDDTLGLLLTQRNGVWATGAQAALPANAAKTQYSWVTVSCGSATACTGVGFYTDNEGVTQGMLNAGSAVASVVVPNLKGKPLRVAERWIMSHGCSVGKIKRAASSHVKRGRVISQKPRPGTTLKNPTKISFVVSKGRR